LKFAQILFLVLVVLSLNISAADDVSRLEAAKKALESHDEIEQFRGYNECKTIYLRANLNKNTDLARDALSGIVKGGETLGIDVAKYRSELAKLQPQIATPSPVTTASSIVAKAYESPQKILVFPKEYLKAPTAPAKDGFLTPSSTELFKQAELIKTPTEKEPSKPHRLVDTKWKETGLELLFDTPVDAKDVHLSKIIESDKQRFRYIVDIDSGKLSQDKVLEHKSINKLRLGQYDAKTLRLVIEHSQAISVKTTAKGSSVLIDFSLPTTAKELLTKPATISSEIDLPPLPPLLGPPPILSTSPALESVTPRDRSKKVIVIDPGHGGKDSGAIGNGYMEKEIVLQIGLELNNQLKAMGYTVYMTRSTDVFIELKDRTKFANDKSADLFLSVHANAIPKGADANAAYGIETYFLSPGRSERAMRVAALENSEDMGEMGAFGKLSFLNVLNTEKIIASNKLAIDIQKGVLNNLRKQFPNVKDNSVREAPFWVLVGAQMPAILLETGYISNPDESARIADSKYQKWMVEGMIDGVKHYFANNP